MPAPSIKRERTVQPCIDCGNPTRPADIPLTFMPGTVQRRASGRCVSCQRRVDKAKTRPPRTCQWCAAPLSSTLHGTRRFCSTQCQQADWMARRAPDRRPDWKKS